MIQRRTTKEERQTMPKVTQSKNKGRELTPKAREAFAFKCNQHTQQLRELLAQWLGLKEARAYYLHAWPEINEAGGFEGVKFHVLTRWDLFKKEGKDREKLEQVREFVAMFEALGFKRARAIVSSGRIEAITKPDEEGQHLEEWEQLEKLQEETERPDEEGQE